MQTADQKRLDVAAAGRDTPLPDRAAATPDAKGKGKAAPASKDTKDTKKGVLATQPTLDPTLNAPASSEDVAAAVAAVVQATKASVKASSDAFYSKRDPSGHRRGPKSCQRNRTSCYATH